MLRCMRHPAIDTHQRLERDTHWDVPLADQESAAHQSMDAGKQREVQRARRTEVASSTMSPSSNSRDGRDRWGGRLVAANSGCTHKLLTLGGAIDPVQ
jgi:hypothetical protein